MKLLYSITSPYARKVRVVPEKKRIDVRKLQVVLAYSYCPVINHNPLGKIPVLILPDGDSLYDSRVIVEYLDHRRPVACRSYRQDCCPALGGVLADGVMDAAIPAVT